jgi:1-acyl-sn-glycerol-3-phosphate acyltransferase
MPNTFLSRALLFIPSALQFIAMCAISFFFSTLYLLALPLPYSWRYVIAQQWGRNNIRALRIFAGIKLEVEGSKEIPKDTPFIIFAKHQSSYEIMALMAMMSPTSWVAKRELLKIPIFGWAFGLSKPITIDRGAGKIAVNQLVTQGIQALEEGRNVLIFPEGTRTAAGAKPNYRIGGAILAEKSGYPILPVAHNSGEVWPRLSFIKWPGTVKLSFGPLIDTKNKKAAEISAEAQEWIENKMREISNPENWDR